MNQILKSRFSVLVFAVSVFIFSAQTANANTIAAPTLLKINTQSSYAITAPVISGVTASGTGVLVYIDDVFAGNAKIQKSNAKTNSFYFQAFGLGEGTHSAYLIAEDEKTLERSVKSKIFNITISPIPAPTLVVPNEKTITAKLKPLVEGFTKSGTFVHLYIDGKYNGKTKIVEDISGTAHFAYEPFLNLNIGKHTIWAVSEDISGRKSKVSAVLSFGIEKNMPAPTILKTNVINYSNDVRIIGLSKNDAKIKVYVDHKLDGEFNVVNHKSGTANFAYKLKSRLSKRSHLIYAVAVDKRGKESTWSKIIYVNKPQPKPVPVKPQVSAISEEGATEEIDKNNVSASSEAIKENEINLKKIKDYLVFAELFKSDKNVRLSKEQYDELGRLLAGKTIIEENDRKALEELERTKDNNSTTSQGTKNEETKTDEKDNGENASSTESLGGPIDEKKNSQSTIGWNALIFILFLMAVIAWIFWVNRELIKERQEQEPRIDDGKEENN